ncbi:MAG TPA: twin-arginine translocase subunit TatC [Tepidisphaeraceae bacterium]|jgi:sec-independent protein translocase protein TatC
MAEPPVSSFDPDAYRMTLGDHLEELRRRLIQALLGFAIAAVFCLIFGTTVVSYFCKPLIDALKQSDVNPQLYTNNVGDVFSIYLQISMICACVIASPWMVWQLWLFVAAGLYPNERKTITRYVPLSITLLIVGDLFVYYVILPLTLQFFLAFSLSIPLPLDTTIMPASTQPVNVLQIPSLPGTPASPPELGMWYDSMQQRLKIVVDGKVRMLPFGPESLVAPQFQLPDYIDLVLNMLVVFGLSFQLPLIVLTLVKVGILEVEQLRALRKTIYFVMGIISAVITPGDAITATVGLMLPLCLLFEFGVLLGARSAKADTERLA